MGSANLTERASFDLRYNRAIKAAQREAANRHLSTWAWKGAGHAAEGSAGLSSNRVDVPQGTVPTDYSNYPGTAELCITRAPVPGAAGPPGGSHGAGAGRGAVPACGSQVCQQGKKLWEEESRWDGIKGDVKETDRILSAAMERGELDPCYDPLRRGG